MKLVVEICFVVHVEVSIISIFVKNLREIRINSFRYASSNETDAQLGMICTEHCQFIAS